MEQEVLRADEAVINRGKQSRKRRENEVNAIIFSNNFCGSRSSTSNFFCR